MLAKVKEGRQIMKTRSIWKMLGPFATASRRTPHCHSPGVTACASMFTTTTTTTTTTTPDRGDRYGPMEWAQLSSRDNIIGLDVFWGIKKFTARYYWRTNKRKKEGADCRSYICWQQMVMYVALKWEANDRWRWSHRTLSKTCSRAEYTL